MPILTSLSLAACGGDTEKNSGAPEAGCEAVTLPLAGSGEAPSLTALRLDCTRLAVELLAIVSDSSDEDLDDVEQIFRVHRSAECDGGVLEITDDVIGSGEVEAFGIVFEKSELPELYAEICGAERWPVDAELRDVSGNVTARTVWATVTRHEP